MQFLEDIVFTCDDCKGMKVKPLYGSISNGEVSFTEALNNPMGSILSSLKLTPKYLRLFELVKMFKLDYLSLDRKFNSLSGGERQRVLLLSRQQKKIENSILIFENLSVGLSLSDLESLLPFFNDLVSSKNMVIVIDPNEVWSQFSNFHI